MTIAHVGSSDRCREVALIHLTAAPLRLVALMVVLLFVAACTSDPATTELAADTTEPKMTADDQDEWATTLLPTDMVQNLLEACPGIAPSPVGDQWSSLERSVDANVAQLVRNRTSHFAQPNPTSCQAPTSTEPAVAPGTVGAAAAAAYRHEDPDVRWDVYVFATADDASSAREAVGTSVAETFDPPREMVVSAVGQNIIVVESYPEPLGSRTDPRQRIVRWYGQLVAGFE